MSLCRTYVSDIDNHKTCIGEVSNLKKNCWISDNSNTILKKKIDWFYKISNLLYKYLMILKTRNKSLWTSNEKKNYAKKNRNILMDINLYY